MKYIADACGGELHGPPGLDVRSLCSDSRKASAGDFFLAIPGEKFDGHDFLAEVVRRRVKAVMVERGQMAKVVAAFAGAGEVPHIVVDQVRTALGRWAAEYRRSFTLAVFAVAGSNGKTTTKELLASVLRQRFETLWNEASFNNDLGVPLTALRLERKHEAAVFEVGTNHPGELEPLVRIARPLFGVLTSIGREHLEFFGDLAGVAREEGSLAEQLPAGGKLFVHAENEWTEAAARRSRATVVRVGMGEGVDWRATHLQLDAQGVTFQVETSGSQWGGEYRVNVLGRHQVTNALLALAAGAEMGLTREELARGLAQAQPPKMRLQVWELNGVRVLDDAYNANADSTLAALQTLADFPCAGRRIAVLGDLAELGGHAEAAHRETGKRAAELKLDLVMAVGGMAAATAAGARTAGLEAVEQFADAGAAGTELKTRVKPGDVVLLKASRAARLERVSEILKGETAKV
ncbi:MAG: UDP-N-acetylmuramoyl-tripeptide--D-alanyl-D-alanine ligase [Verrucomicrobiota bacterium]